MNGSEVIDGRRIAADLKASVAGEVKQLRADGLGAGLATVVVGDDFSAKVYERRLARLAVELDVEYRPHTLPATATQDQVLDLVGRLNAEPAISGVLILRPLPPQVSEVQVFRALSPLKDIEAVHPENAGLLALGTPRYVPSTAASAFHVLDRWLDKAGEDRADFYHRSLIVVVGRSNNVGKPAVSLAYARQAAVESIDEWASRSHRLGWHTRRADVLIVAAGVPGLIHAEHIHEGAIVLDVGINLATDPANGAVRIVGDVDFDAVAPRARAITPVPGGIGPVTDVWLLRNTVLAARHAASLASEDTQPQGRQDAPRGTPPGGVDGTTSAS
jgi:methylenetetrahydrofolate dehydrogenase (NADP+) / methenyltetrahydrofolate cyclohydrolase